MLCHLFLVSLSAWKSAFYLNATHPSDHSHLCSLKCHLIFFPYRPAWPGLICMEHTVCTLYISFIAELALTAMSQIVYQAAAGQWVLDCIFCHTLLINVTCLSSMLHVLHVIAVFCYCSCIKHCGNVCSLRFLQRSAFICTWFLFLNQSVDCNDSLQMSWWWWMLLYCRSGNYGEYQQSAMYIPVSGLYYQQDAQVCRRDLYWYVALQAIIVTGYLETLALFSMYVYWWKAAFLVIDSFH